MPLGINKKVMIRKTLLSSIAALALTPGLMGCDVNAQAPVPTLCQQAADTAGKLRLGDDYTGATDVATEGMRGNVIYCEASIDTAKYFERLSGKADSRFHGLHETIHYKVTPFDSGGFRVVVIRAE